MKKAISEDELLARVTGLAVMLCHMVASHSDESPARPEDFASEALIGLLMLLDGDPAYVEEMREAWKVSHAASGCKQDSLHHSKELREEIDRYRNVQERNAMMRDTAQRLSSAALERLMGQASAPMADSLEVD